MSELLVTKEWIEANKHLVTLKQSTKYPDLFVIKYKNKVFYDNLWTPALQQCRGLVLDKDYNVIVRPFDKIFNYGENGTTFKCDDMCVYSRKVNGFMGAVTYSERYDHIYSTTGSLDSDYARLVEKHLKQYEGCLNKPGLTVLFEICDYNDPHIIKEDLGAYLIGAVWSTNDWHMGYHETETSLDGMADMFGLKRFNSKVGRFSDIVKESKECKHEGYVVRLQEDPTKFLKIKSPYYLTTKFLARKRGDKLVELLYDVQQAKRTIDEEYYPLLDYLSNIKDEFITLPEQERISKIEAYFMEGQIETKF